MESIRTSKKRVSMKVFRTLKDSQIVKNSIRESNRGNIQSNEIKEIKQSMAIDPTEHGFYIDPISLENIISNYKDRVLYNNNNIIKEYPDITFFEKQYGIKTLIDSLQTDIEKGINIEQHREEIFGSNKNYLEDLPPFSLYLLEAFEDPMVQLLILCAVISIILGCTLSDDPSTDWIDGLSIIIVVLIVVLVSSTTKYQERKQFLELNKIQADGTKYKVIRKGEIKEILSEDILVGDLILINYGEIIPVDILLTEGNHIKMDEYALTGETFPAKKEIFTKCKEIKDNGGINVPSPLILSGTKCIQGNGKGIVLCVGVHSQKYLIRTIIDTNENNIDSPLSDSLENVSRIIAFFGFCAGAVILISLFIQFGIEFHRNMKIYKKYFHIKNIIHNVLFNYPYKTNDSTILSIAMKDNVTNPNSMIAKKILDIIILSISIIVTSIPEGLSSAITLSFAFSLKKMMKNHNLIRKIEACEKMGSANYLCIDKTGILTTNSMSITKILMGNNEIKEINCNDNQKIKLNPLDVFSNENYWEILKLAMSLNIECQIQNMDKDDEIDDMYEKCDSWNKTDKSFLNFLNKFGVSIVDKYDYYLSEPDNYKIFEFNPKNKRMTTYIHHEDFPSEYRLFSKGAAEYFSKFCDKYMDPNTGDIKKMDEEMVRNINKSILDFNKNKMRTLYIAYKDITNEDFENCENEQNSEENDMIFLCIIIIKDPIQVDIKDTIEKCKNSFINLIVTTGDNIMTATSIAKECGILNESLDLNNLDANDIEQNPNLIDDQSKKNEYMESILFNQPKILTGNTFYKLIGGIFCKECNKGIDFCFCPKTDEEAIQLAEKNVENNLENVGDIRKEAIKNMENFETIIKNLKVIARAEPIHKYSLVLGLKSLKNIVAVTGKGTHDAPTLDMSDIGISMFSGTDIAKEASDIILINNNFSSIITAIIYGRNICENIRKFLQFQLTVNFSSCFSVFICTLIGNETPLTPIQLLWINLIMDSFGSLSLATEPPYNDILMIKPKKRKDPLITGKMCKHIFFQSIILIGLILFLYTYGPKFIPEDNYVKIAENLIIKYCYGQIPGTGSNERFIISGSKNDWPADIKLKENINKDYCGRYSSRQTLNVAFKEYININCNTSHMTIVYNVFVFYSLFNQINCRVLDDSLNIFKHINKSYLFLTILLFEIIIQIIIIFFGNTVFHICFMGLTWKQWLISLGFSAITFLISIIVKFIKIDKYLDVCFTSNEEDDNNSIDDSLSYKIKNIDSEISTFEKKLKLDESNITNKDYQKGNVNELKLSSFSEESELSSNINNK